MTLGIVDVGTNSIHLLIGILGLNGTFHVILKERDLTRLGEGGLTKNRLTRAAMKRAEGVLSGYAATLRRCRVDQIEAVTTSAVRGATNGQAFVRRIRRRLGLPLRIISGREEARLIYLGVMHAQPARRASVILTIGGGSAQVICGSGLRLGYVTSLPLGCARMAQRFIRHDPPLFEEVAALTAHVRRAWQPVALMVARHRWQQALASSATIAQVMIACYVWTHHRPPKDKHRLSLSQRALRPFAQWLSRSTARQRMQLDGLDPRREDLALPTAITLLAWMEACDVPSISYAPGSLREGLIIDDVIRHHERIRAIEQPLADMLWANGHRTRAVDARTRLLKRLRWPSELAATS